MYFRRLRPMRCRLVTCSRPVAHKTPVAPLMQFIRCFGTLRVIYCFSRRQGGISVLVTCRLIPLRMFRSTVFLVMIKMEFGLFRVFFARFRPTSGRVTFTLISRCLNSLDESLPVGITLSSSAGLSLRCEGQAWRTRRLFLLSR